MLSTATAHTSPRVPRGTPSDPRVHVVRSGPTGLPRQVPRTLHVRCKPGDKTCGSTDRAGARDTLGSPWGRLTVLQNWYLTVPKPFPSASKARTVDWVFHRLYVIAYTGSYKDSILREATVNHSRMVRLSSRVRQAFALLCLALLGALGIGLGVCALPHSRRLRRTSRTERQSDPN